MNVATNLSQIEKIYANSYNHDVKAPIVYANSANYLFADAEFTKPVSLHILHDLFYAGVIIITHDGHLCRPFWVQRHDDGTNMFIHAMHPNGSSTMYVAYDHIEGYWCDPD